MPPVSSEEVVIALAELDAAHLRDAYAPPVAAVIVHDVVERDHAVRDAMQLNVGRIGCVVVEQQHNVHARVAK